MRLHVATFRNAFGCCHRLPRSFSSKFSFPTPQYRGSIQRKFFASSPRRGQKARPQEYRAPNKSTFAYPSRLLIYHAGDQKTSYIAFWKATTIALFGISSVVFAPRIYYSETESHAALKALGFVVIGTIPMVLVSYLTAPFVNSISIRLPEYARRSRDVLLRFAKNPPSNTEIEFVTIRFLPFRKTTGVVISEMRTITPKWGSLANLVRIRNPTAQRQAEKKLIWEKALAVLAEERFRFYVREDSKATRRSRAPGVWEEVYKYICKNSV